MFNKDVIIKALQSKGWSRYKLCKEAKLAQSTVSDILSGESKNPNTMTLQKIADILEIPVSDFFKDENEPTTEQMTEEYNKMEQKLYSKLSFTNEVQFKTAQEAMKFILEQPAIMGYGGFNINKMTKEEIIEFANELLSQLKLLGYKYKK